MRNCESCEFWSMSICHRAGSPYQGERTRPDCNCDMHEFKKRKDQGLKLQVVGFSQPLSDEVFAISSLRLCPGTSILCPMCFGIAVGHSICGTCNGTGRVGLAKEQPGLVKITNIGKA